MSVFIGLISGLFESAAGKPCVQRIAGSLGFQGFRVNGVMQYSNFV
jgi:hypothetical protein